MTVHSILQSLPRYYLNDLSEEGGEESGAKPKPFGLDAMKGRKMGLLSSTQTRDRTVSGRTVSGVSGAIPTWIFPKLLIIPQNYSYESNGLKSLIHAQFF